MPAGVIRRKEENMTTAKVHVSPTTLLFHFEQGLILQFGDVEMAAGVEPTLPRKTAGSGPTASEKQEHYRAMIKWKDARSDVSRFREVGIACIMISAAPLASILANESTLSSVPGIQGLDRTFIFFRSRAEAENLLRKKGLRHV
jgi:hypothetical protein